MKAGKNVWKCDEMQGCGHEFKNEERPQKCPKCGFYMVGPKVNLKRVHGQTYQYYPENSPWEIAANDALKRLANQNFRKRR